MPSLARPIHTSVDSPTTQSNATTVSTGSEVLDYLQSANDGLNYGELVDEDSIDFTDRKDIVGWDEVVIEDHSGDEVIVYIELGAESEMTFSDVRDELQDRGPVGEELFAIVGERQEDNTPINSKLTAKLSFLQLTPRYMSEDVEMKWDIDYFTLSLESIEPVYHDFLEKLSVEPGETRSSLSSRVDEVFSVEQITQHFYEEFGELFRTELQDAISGLEDPDENLNTYTRTVVNRVLFLLFIEQKEWLESPQGDTVDYVESMYTRTREEANEDDEGAVYNNFFKPLFFEALSNRDSDEYEKLGRVPFLNGGLFEKKSIEEDVVIENSFFDALLDPETDDEGVAKGFLQRYKFTLKESNPSEQELVVDPEFVGRVFEMFMQSGERSELGAFYTPKPITQYMAKNCLKNHLLNTVEGLKERQARILVTDHSLVDGVSQTDADNALQSLKQISILDPAVGSGAFTIAILEELVHMIEALKGEALQADERYALKENLIAKNIHGVDIDPGGIELCKFRTWLYLIQDLKISLDEFLDNNDEYALPNLDFKFVDGNSLVGEVNPTDLRSNYQSTFDGNPAKIIDRIEKLRYEHLTAHGEKKEVISKDIEDLTQALNHHFAVRHTGDWMNDVEDEGVEGFSWALTFPEVILSKPEGFDVVVGNPPYEGQSKKEYVDAISDRYDMEYDFYTTIPGMRYDLYQKFIIRGWELTREGGVLSYITSDTFCTIGSKQSTRCLLQQNKLHELIRVNPNTFDASVTPAIFTLEKNTPTAAHQMSYIDATDTPIDEYRSLIHNMNNPQGDDPGFVGETPCKIKMQDPTRGYTIDLEVYKNTIRNAFFEPNEKNMRAYERFMKQIQKLSTRWEDEIKNATTLEESFDRIQDQHISQLTDGSVTILGLITHGGVGMGTGSVEEFTAYLDGCEDAKKIKQRNADAFEYVKKNSNTFRYRSRVIQDQHIRTPSTLSEDERSSGIDGPWDGETWVPIEKGFKKGETYFKETYEYVNWSKDAVDRLKEEGNFRNMEYSFDEGILISTGGFSDLAVRYTNNRIIGAPLVIFTTNTEQVSEKYLVGVLMSERVNDIAKTFLNSSGMQTTDVRHIPIVIPDTKQKTAIENLVDEAIDCRKGTSSRDIKEVRSDIEEIVERLYS